MSCKFDLKYEDRKKKKDFLDNLDKVTNLYSMELVNELDLNGSYEGQIRAIKVLTDFADFGKRLSDQIDRMEDMLHAINFRMMENNNKIMKELDKIQQ